LTIETVASGTNTDPVWSSVKNADPLMTSKGIGAIAQSDLQAGTAFLEVEKLFEISVHGKIGRLSDLVRLGALEVSRGLGAI
jgi:hypothetical protein